MKKFVISDLSLGFKTRIPKKEIITDIKMAIRNDLKNGLWRKLQNESVSWGMLALWICGLVVLLAMMTMYSGA
ncbi:MAG: hypothetical protein AAF630_17675 [Cyanobacteria bacterium P01_C01_bin.38]